MFLFGTIGIPEMLIVLLILVIMFGAKRLPELGKSLGEGIKNFKKSVTGAKEDKDKQNDSQKLPPKDE